MKRIDPKNRPVSNLTWIAGFLALLLLVAGVMMFLTRGPVSTAANTSVSTPSPTTGAAPARPATPAR